MTIKHALLRLAAASAATALLTIGAMGPVHAADGKAAEGSTRSDSQGAAKKTEKKDRPEKVSTDKPAHRSAEVGSGPQPESNADRNDGGANSYDCENGPKGPYCATPYTESENGKGDGKATGRPLAGSVGKADNKNPLGQEPGPSDRNNGYECDGNQGIAQGNPAHTTCTDGQVEEGQVEEGQVEEGDEDETSGEGGNGDGHTPVTVCHPLPNGKYLILTFDDDALDAHIGHGDLLLEDVAACPGSVPDGGVAPPADAGPDTELTTDSELDPETEGEAAVVTIPTSGIEVLGVEKTIENVGVELYRNAEATAPVVNDDVVAGVEAEAAPAAGFLPNTGAGQYGVALLAGVGLLAAGVTLLARRRPLGGR